MRIVRNGPKRHLYLSASERRALNRIFTYSSVRCVQCNRQRYYLRERYQVLACESCGWWATLGKDIFVSFAKVMGRNSTTQVQKIVSADGVVIYEAPALWTEPQSYGGDIRL